MEIKSTNLSLATCGSKESKSLWIDALQRMFWTLSGLRISKQPDLTRGSDRQAIDFSILSVSSWTITTKSAGSVVPCEFSEKDWIWHTAPWQTNPVFTKCYPVMGVWIGRLRICFASHHGCEPACNADGWMWYEVSICMSLKHFIILLFKTQAWGYLTCLKNRYVVGALCRGWPLIVSNFMGSPGISAHPPNRWE